MAHTTGQRRVQECAGATDFFSFTTWHHAFRELKRVFLLRLNRIVISRANSGGIVPPGVGVTFQIEVVLPIGPLTTTCKGRRKRRFSLRVDLRGQVGYY
jgi:hypothetical protein